MKSERAGRYEHKKRKPEPEKVPTESAVLEDDFTIPEDQLYEF